MDTLAHCPRCLNGKLFEFGGIVSCICCGHEPRMVKPLPIVVKSAWRAPAWSHAGLAERRSA